MTDTPVKQAAITSPDIQQERISELKRLFPDLFDGEGQLDEFALKALCNPDGTSTTERFRFEWAGKQESKRLAFKPSRATLIADKDIGDKKGRSIDFDTTQNMIIEGDNLEVLKLLRTTYFEQVKCIYIDPPYNTSNDFIYPDNFTEGKKAYWQKNGTIKDGVKLQAVTESSGRKHSNWLNMMQSRLLLAQQLLREDGVIFISIDDNEQTNLKKLCDEIFGEENFLGVFLWKKKTNGNNMGHIPPVHDYILVYSKSILDNLLLGFPITEDFINKTYSNPDNDPKGAWTTSDLSANHEGPHFPIYNPDTGEEYYPAKGRYWVFNQEEVLQRIKSGRIIFGKSGTSAPVQKKYLRERSSMRFKPESWWDSHGLNSDATAEMAELFSPKIFTHPKPTSLLKNIVNISTENDDIILDFFAGSGTTAHAVMQLNAEDGGNRKYICVQIPEYTPETSEAFKAGYKTISQLCIERVKRAGTKIKSENPDKALDTGFRVYKLTDSHFPENLFTSDPEKSEAENLQALEAHIKATENKTLFDADNLPNIITEISLKNGYGLFFTLETLGDFNKNTMYRLTGNDKSTLLCLDDVIDEATVDTLIDQYNTHHLIISKYGLDTAKKWTLQNTFKDNMQVV